MFTLSLIGVEAFEILEQRVGRFADALLEVPKLFAGTIGDRVAAEARSMLGEYQSAEAGPSGSYPAWAQLTPQTLARRANAGHNPANQPLLERGWGHDVIHTTPPIDVGGGSVEFVIGYRVGLMNDAANYMLYHEIGTADMPARPVLGPAVIHVMRDIGDALGPLTYNHFNVRMGMGVYP